MLTNYLAKHLPRYLISGCRCISYQISEEVQNTISSNGPVVVALESTIITHGMPYPENVETAQSVENVIRENGAIPATIGILNGQVKIGMTKSEIEELAYKSNADKTIKVSRRDLPYVIGQKLNGGTTVAATMILASAAKIPLFVTGGIGGVHRGAETSFDISADLTELGRTPITVICAGVKSILDIEKTLEYLETEGVTVATYGSNAEFPAFFTSKSGFKSPYCIENPTDAAKVIKARDDLNLSNAILLAVPTPGKAEDEDKFETAIKKAVADAESCGIVGKEATPFILERLNQYTKGISLDLNRQLILHNAKVGAQIATEFFKLRNGNVGHKSKNTITVIGGTNVDYVMNVNEDVTFQGLTLDGKIQRFDGGVGRNLADCITKIQPQSKPLFISAVGHDALGQEFKKERNVEGRAVEVIGDENTATYSAVINKHGDYLFGIGDMAIHEKISSELVLKFKDDIVNSALVVLDGNTSQDAMEQLLELCSDNDVPIWYEPTDPRKAAKPFAINACRGLTYISPNFTELQTIYKHFHGQETAIKNSHDQVSEAAEMCKCLFKHIPAIIVTLGDNGVLICCQEPFGKGIQRPSAANSESAVTIKHYSAMKIPKKLCVSVSGAGDCLAGTVISGLIQGYNLDVAVKAGIFASTKSINSKLPVPPTISPQIFDEARSFDISVSLVESL